MFVGNVLGGTVSVLNTHNTIVATIPTASRNYQLAYNSRNHDVYVEGDLTNSVTVINSKNRVVMNIELGNSREVPAFDSANDKLYIPNYDSGTISIISSSNVVLKTITVGGNPADSLYVPYKNNDVYVTNQGTDTVSVVSG
jgi:YVTN family beta-propeller protein